MKHLRSVFVVATILITSVKAQFFYKVVNHGQGAAIPEYHVFKVDGGTMSPAGEFPFALNDCRGHYLHLTNEMMVDVWLQRGEADTEIVKLSPNAAVGFSYNKEYPWIVATITQREVPLTRAEFREIVDPVAKKFHEKYNTSGLKGLTKKFKLLLGSKSQN
ncbi:uncharacterized protein PGTG_05373 [Puccinia graminis f. sp. tritici CRL 75-36-700-3]|uniref:Uncharacterized protein n=1 Tax=Puccinia graminis f. sp. tritici (strain CRL 75-36-700-3 / race SCCL) TaxID=418459 RepID=E3K6I8_PUCGT|nr:uncharacterized protein PGTG_05373 [Puccinia graminis f. sp. tritici CRL 75-36-700-3]EFP80148.2 hypothetical protein PGTG_05373 [Puccinia graminis f. sp. tritici CRL 75-36-700-3]